MFSSHSPSFKDPVKITKRRPLSQNYNHTSMAHHKWLIAIYRPVSVLTHFWQLPNNTTRVFDPIHFFTYCFQFQKPIHQPNLCFQSVTSNCYLFGTPIQATPNSGGLLNAEIDTLVSLTDKVILSILRHICTISKIKKKICLIFADII